MSTYPYLGFGIKFPVPVRHRFWELNKMVSFLGAKTNPKWERKNFIPYLPTLKKNNFIFYLQLERRLEVGSPPPESGKMKLGVGPPLRESKRFG